MQRATPDPNGAWPSARRSNGSPASAFRPPSSRPRRSCRTGIPGSAVVTCFNQRPQAAARGEKELPHGLERRSRRRPDREGVDEDGWQGSRCRRRKNCATDIIFFIAYRHRAKKCSVRALPFAVLLFSLSGGAVTLARADTVSPAGLDTAWGVSGTKVLPFVEGLTTKAVTPVDAVVAADGWAPWLADYQAWQDPSGRDLGLRAGGHAAHSQRRARHHVEQLCVRL